MFILDMRQNIKSSMLPTYQKNKKNLGAPSKKSRKRLKFEQIDDDTPIAKLFHQSPTKFTPKTPKKDKSEESGHAKLITEHGIDKRTRKKHKKNEQTQSKPAKKSVKPYLTTSASSEQPGNLDIVVPTFTSLKEMSQENHAYNVRAKIVHFWFINNSSIGYPPTGVLLIQDDEHSLMQIIIPELLVENWKDKFVRDTSFEIMSAILLRSTRKTKLVDSPFELHFTDSTTAVQIENLPIDLGPLYNFHSLDKVQTFLPTDTGASTAVLTVKDFIAVVVDCTPLLKRTRCGRVVKFIEAYVMDPSIWPSSDLFTIWEDTALKYATNLLHGFANHFLLIAQHARPHSYSGKKCSSSLQAFTHGNHALF